MNYSNIIAGKNIPEDINVIIEISSNENHIKYEINKYYNNIFVDRFISTSMFYPCNYGYINKTLSLDNDPLDVLIPIPYKLQIGTIIRCRPVGLLKMIDESGIDVKIIAMPHKKISIEFNQINDINDLPSLTKSKIIHFFEHYKDLEKNKWVKIEGWGSADEAKMEILASFHRAKK